MWPLAVMVSSCHSSSKLRRASKGVNSLRLVQKSSHVGYGRLFGYVGAAHRPAASLSWSRAYRVHPSVYSVAIAIVSVVGVVAPLSPGVTGSSHLISWQRASNYRCRSLIKLPTAWISRSPLKTGNCLGSMVKRWSYCLFRWSDSTHWLPSPFVPLPPLLSVVP